MAEWLNAPVSKTGMGASPSGVRIPPSPPALSTLGAAVPGRIITSKHRLNRKLGQEWCPEENHERFEPVNILKRIGTKLPHEEGKPRWTDGLIRHLEMLVSMTQERDWHDGRPIVWMSVQETADRLGISSAQVNEHENALLKLGAVYFDDSANYKRWGRRNERGRIIEAYGINLSPLGRLTNHLRNMDELMAGKRQAWRQAKSAYSGVRRYIKQLLISERGNEIALESALTEFESLVANMKSRPRTRTEDYQAWLAKLEGFRDHLEALLDDPIEVPYEMPCEQPVENPQVSGKMSPKTRCT